MIQVFTIAAIVSFSLAVLLAVAAVIMYFTQHVKQVHDDLTGKTAARSIAEIRSRAKTQRRRTSAAVQEMGWEREVSSSALEEFSKDSGSLARGDDPDEAETALLDDPDEAETALLDDPDEAATTAFAAEREGSR